MPPFVVDQRGDPVPRHVTLQPRAAGSARSAFRDPWMKTTAACSITGREHDRAGKRVAPWLTNSTSLSARAFSPGIAC